MLKADFKCEECFTITKTSAKNFYELKTPLCKECGSDKMYRTFNLSHFKVNRNTYSKNYTR